MGLLEQARLDGKGILEDLAGFSAPFTLTSPAGVAASLRGALQDIGQSIDPETGQAIAGRRASVVVARSSLAALPEAVAESNRKPWLATFASSDGVTRIWKVIEVAPDLLLDQVKLLLEMYAAADP